MRIKVLQQQIANMIAAGEVVERPASVVKELVENAIDANAKSITVEIKNGGIEYIRVTDDGSGMDEDDAQTAFLRHATSKISTAEDLEGIATLGFRGEALASIAAVSQTEIMTKLKGVLEGSFVKIKGGEMVEKRTIGCPEGTTVIVRNLFFNTPARMKFLKKDSTEAGYILDILQKIALSMPNISIRYINNTKEVFFTPGDSKLSSAVYAIYGKDIVDYMIEVNYSDKGINVYGLIGNSSLARPNRNMQTFFVNGRCVANKTLYFALAESYKNQLMVGKFAVAVLNIAIDPTLVDVNVHPSKTEVKFSDDRAVYDVLYWGAKNALYKTPDVREFHVAPKVIKQEESFVQEKLEYSNTVPEYKPLPKEQEIRPISVKEEFVPIAQYMPVVSIKEENLEETTILTKHEFRIIGQLFKTYIIAEQNDEMLIIDQHAAHERLIFEKLKKQRENKRIESQILMLSVTVDLSPIEFSCFSENKEFFEKLGFELEAFGNNSVIVRMIPCEIMHEDIKSLVIEIIDLLRSNKKDIITEVEEKAIERISCKSALKANKALSQDELSNLVLRVLELEAINTCPHGRPICMRTSKNKIEKEFKRI